MGMKATGIWPDRNAPLQSEKIADGTYRIIEGRGPSSVYSYLLLGDERAMMIDTGYGNRHLPETISGITQLPVSAVLSHGHFDHIGGAAFFDEVSICADDCETYNQSLEIMPSELQVPPVSALQLFTDGERFDLGNRVVRVIGTPGHTKGSVCFFDESARLLFTADTCCKADVLLAFDTSASLKIYRNSVRKLERLMSRAGLEMSWPAHHETPVRADIVREFRQAADLLLRGAEGIPTECFGKPARRFLYQDIAIVYQAGKM